ncbi:hypothetical protein ALON55S_02952 [Alishewanella longhuensis]
MAVMPIAPNCCSFTELPCPTIVANALGLKRNEPVFFSLIVHFSDSLPLQLEARYVNPKQVPLYTRQLRKLPHTCI